MIINKKLSLSFNEHIHTHTHKKVIEYIEKHEKNLINHFEFDCNGPKWDKRVNSSSMAIINGKEWVCVIYK